MRNQMHMGRILYADVEYFGRRYLDAEFADGQWCFECFDGALVPFNIQSRVNAVTTLSAWRRHPAHKSGHVCYVRADGSTAE